MVATPVNPVTVDTWERLLRFQRSTTRLMDNNLAAKHGYNLDDYDILHQLATHGEPIRMGELAQALLVANSSCNRQVGRLVADGLIARTPGEVDRREVFVSLTTEGKKLYRRMARTHGRDIEAAVGAPLSKKSLTSLQQILGDLLSATEP